MTPLVPVSRAVPTERTPLTLLPPSQPRPVNENENISKDATAVVTALDTGTRGVIADQLNLKY